MNVKSKEFQVRDIVSTETRIRAKQMISNNIME